MTSYPPPTKTLNVELVNSLDAATLESLRDAIKDFPTYRKRCGFIERYRFYKRRQLIVSAFGTAFCVWAVFTAGHTFFFVLQGILTLWNAWFLADAIVAFAWELPRLQINNEAIHRVRHLLNEPD